MEILEFASSPGSLVWLWIVAAAAWASVVITYALSRILAGSKFMVDTPNRRSSHTVAASRAGGLAVFGGFLAGILIMAHMLSIMKINAAGELLMFGTIALLAYGLGAVDDLRGLSPRHKLAGQVVVAVLFTALIGSINVIPAPALGNVDIGLLGPVLTVFWIVAFMNAFNFMDGINGIAASCGLFALSALAVAGVIGGAGMWPLPALMMSAAIVGFAPVNLMGGRLFLGDGGSQSIGFVIAALAVIISRQSDGGVSPLFIPTAMMPFLFDVAFTLAHRLIRGEPLLAAHREHLYQLLQRSSKSHAAVTARYFVATAFSCAVAMAMLSLPPDTQFLAPLALAIVLLPVAISIFRKASRTGLIAPGVQDAVEASNPAPIPAAAAIAE